LKYNYFIKKGYKTLNEIKKFDIKYWEDNYKNTNKPLYFQYYVYKFARKILKKNNLESVLDIGCRDARKLMKLLFPICNEIYGIDHELYFINYCKKKYKLANFFVDDIENSNLNLNKTFDLIISADVIEHLLDPDSLILYIKRFSHKNSYIILSTPERDRLRGPKCGTSISEGHIREWNFKEFKDYLNYNGFEVISHKIVFNTKFFHIIWNFFFEGKKKLKVYFNNFIILLKIILLKKSKERRRTQSTQLVLCKLRN